MSPKFFTSLKVLTRGLPIKSRQFFGPIPEPTPPTTSECTQLGHPHVKGNGRGFTRPSFTFLPPYSPSTYRHLHPEDLISLDLRTSSSQPSPKSLVDEVGSVRLVSVKYPPTPLFDERDWGRKLSTHRSTITRGDSGSQCVPSSVDANELNDPSEGTGRDVRRETPQSQFLCDHGWTPTTSTVLVSPRGTVPLTDSRL